MEPELCSISNPESIQKLITFTVIPILESGVKLDNNIIQNSNDNKSLVLVSFIKDHWIFACNQWTYKCVRDIALLIMKKVYWKHHNVVWKEWILIAHLGCL